MRARRWYSTRRSSVGRIASALIGLSMLLAADTTGTLTLAIKDYATMPITGKSTDGSDRRVARAGELDARGAGRREPASSSTISTARSTFSTRATKKLTTYLDFNGRDGRPRPLPQARLRHRIRQRPDQLAVRSRLRAQRPVLHDSSRRARRSPVRRCPTRRACPALDLAGYSRRRPSRRRRRSSAKAC